MGMQMIERFTKEKSEQKEGVLKLVREERKMTLAGVEYEEISRLFSSDETDRYIVAELRQVLEERLNAVLHESARDALTYWLVDLTGKTVKKLGVCKYIYHTEDTREDFFMPHKNEIPSNAVVDGVEILLTDSGEVETNFVIKAKY